MARVYATPDDLAAYTGTTAPDDATAQLARATRMLESSVLRQCWYRVDDTGMPTEQIVADALRDVMCAQVAWWIALGDSTGALGAGWTSIKIGSVDLSRSGKGGSGGGGAARPDGSDSAARQVAPEVWDILQSPDLTPHHLRIGEIRSWLPTGPGVCW